MNLIIYNILQQGYQFEYIHTPNNAENGHFKIHTGVFQLDEHIYLKIPNQVNFKYQLYFENPQHANFAEAYVQGIAQQLNMEANYTANYATIVLYDFPNIPMIEENQAQLQNLIEVNAELVRAINV